MMHKLLEKYKLPIQEIETVQELGEYKDTIISLAMLQFSKQEIAQTLMCNTNLLEEWAILNYNLDFERVKDTFRARANMLILDKQYESALEDKNTKMLQFLGKNYLKQVDDGTKSVVNLNADRVVFNESETEQELAQDMDIGE